MSDDRKQEEHTWAEEIVFLDNLDLFATKVGLLVALTEGNKKSPEEAFEEIKALYKKLKKTKKGLLGK